MRSLLPDISVKPPPRSPSPSLEMIVVASFESTFQMKACLLELALSFDLLSSAVPPTPVLRCVSLTPQVMLPIVLR